MKWFAAHPSHRLEVPGAALSDLVRRQRHAFLNDLQVFGGWLQLGRLASAVEYLARVQSRLTRDGSLSLLGNPDLEAAMLLAWAQAEKLGVPFSVTVDGASAYPYDPAEARAAAAAALDGAVAAPAPDGAGRVGPGARWGCSAPVGLASAVLALTPPIIERASRTGASLDLTLGGAAGSVDRVTIRILGSRNGAIAASPWPGLEDAAMAGSGFTPVESGAGGDVGLEWRSGPIPSGFLRVAETTSSVVEAELTILGRTADDSSPPRPEQQGDPFVR